ncbi:hypothetical protein AMECASPLE_015139 [Ameca splendens]|uniref:Uncharacterized protein n=1 Tax=Ameca splendens TaxID=208324 RepID=A0ABV0ZNE7_9TELE
MSPQNTVTGSPWQRASVWFCLWHGNKGASVSAANRTKSGPDTSLVLLTQIMFLYSNEGAEFYLWGGAGTAEPSSIRGCGRQKHARGSQGVREDARRCQTGHRSLPWRLPLSIDSGMSRLLNEFNTLPFNLLNFYSCQKKNGLNMCITHIMQAAIAGI